ncbi:ABC transporter substrate-binding protein [Roseisalinus antarcticus]|uniref:Probable sugar-binding periplasmic protein n=1 Tax=Roseisalinus antarcticus TaxID=254357 RepID=A0A1Y5TGQ5_9RHOB|nr:ABC transporter substrate-binding protein [Roseisalinus antarcticus]SLN61615.1 putative sugar-binding periplasmic protein precursor [Roseisalinus antarcticus]
MQSKTRLMGCAGVAAVMLGAPLAQADEVEVIHWLSSGAEAAAVQALANGVEALGTTWVEIVPPDHASGARALFTSRIGGGNPPGAMFLSIGKEAADLGEQGVLRDISGFVADEGPIDALPQFAVDIASGPDGALYAVPIAVETQNVMWYSVRAYEAAGLEPPTDWEGFLEQAPALQDAGIIPIAVGAQGWQLNLLQYSIQTSLLGVDGFGAFYFDHDRDGFDEADVTRAFEIIRTLSELADDGNVNRSWTDTLNLVANDEAAIFVMGTWAGGELVAMGEEYGTDWGCNIAGGDTWIAGATGFRFPDLGAPSEGQDDFIRALLTPEVQVQFSIEKGSIPSLTSASSIELPECSQAIAQGMQEGRGVPNPNATLSGDAQGQISDLLMNFWSDPGVSPQDAAENYTSIVFDDF